MITAHGTDVPTEFRAALDSLAAQRLRPEVTLREIPAPGRVAPYSVALTGEVVGADDAELATGRFILLYDPDGQAAWQGRFRAVTLVRATLEPELAAEDMLAEVAWTWLGDALGAADVAVEAPGGTVTRVLSQSFGALAERADDVELEVRASWTPLSTDVGRHLEAWATLLCTVAGLPPLPDGVTALRPRSHTVDP